MFACSNAVRNLWRKDAETSTKGNIIYSSITPIIRSIALIPPGLPSSNKSGIISDNR